MNVRGLFSRFSTWEKFAIGVCIALIAALAGGSLYTVYSRNHRLDEYAAKSLVRAHAVVQAINRSAAGSPGVCTLSEQFHLYRQLGDEIEKYQYLGDDRLREFAGLDAAGYQSRRTANAKQYLASLMRVMRGEQAPTRCATSYYTDRGTPSPEPRARNLADKAELLDEIADAALALHLPSFTAIDPNLSKDDWNRIIVDALKPLVEQARKQGMGGLEAGQQLALAMHVYDVPADALGLTQDEDDQLFRPSLGFEEERRPDGFRYFRTR